MAEEKSRVEYRRRYYLDNRERLIQKDRERYRRHKERILAKQRERYQRKREEILARQRDHYQLVKEEKTAKQREKYAQMRENLTDAYLLFLIKLRAKYEGWPASWEKIREGIPQELIEANRTIKVLERVTT